MVVAIARGGSELNLSGLRIEGFPPSFGHLARSLRSLKIDQTEIVDLEILNDFRSLIELSLSDTPAFDLTPIARLDQLISLDFGDSHVQNLSPIASLVNLECLYLDDVPAKDIDAIAELQKLTHRSLHSTTIRDLTPLSELHQLENLQASHSEVRDLAPLRNLNRLKHLYLTGTKVVDISALAGLTELEELFIALTSIRDIRPLSKLLNLSILNLSDTEVQDLTPLRNLRRLHRLDVSSTFVAVLDPIADVMPLTDPEQQKERGPIGLYYGDTPAAEKIPFNQLHQLGYPFSTVETINLLRRQNDLPENWPLGYERPDRIEDILSGQFSQLNSDEGGDHLTQRPATFSFALRKGRIEAQASKGELRQPDIAADFYQAITEKAQVSRRTFASSNSPRRLLTSIDGVISALGLSIDDIRPGVLQMRFRSLEADLAAYSAHQGRRELGEEAFAVLADLASSLEDLMGCFPQLAALEADRLALRLQDSDVPAVLRHSEEIKSAARSSDLVHHTAREALAFGEDAIRQSTEVIESPGSRHDERAAAIAARSRMLGQKLLDYRNFVARVLVQARANAASAGYVAANELGGLARDSWTGVRTGFPKGVGKGAQMAGQALTQTAFAALVGMITTPLIGLSTLIMSFDPLGRKSQEIEEAAKQQAPEVAREPEKK